MNILIHSVFYTPELTGIGKYSGEMGAYLAAREHQVQVVTGFPFYPNWKIQKPYKGFFWKREQAQTGEDIIRCPLYVPEQPNAWKRILHEASFLLTSTLALLTCLFQKVDVVICVVTPFHLGIPARIFAWLKGAKMIYHIQDLQVDAARDLGMLNNQSLLALMTRMESWILRKTDIVSSISEGMIRKIMDKGVDRSKIYFFPNWVDTKFIRPLSKEKSLRSELGFQAAEKIVLYSGNLGEKQGLEMLIETANQLRHIEDLQFVIVGEGGIKRKLIQLAKQHQLRNVHFFPLQPFEKLPALLAMADVHLVLQKKAAADLVMPSKLTTILAMGGCAIITAEANSTLHDITMEHQLGVLVEPESSDALEDGILQALFTDKGIYQSNARLYAERFLDKENVLNAFEQLLFELKTDKATPFTLDPITTFKA